MADVRAFPCIAKTSPRCGRTSISGTVIYVKQRNTMARKTPSAGCTPVDEIIVARSDFQNFKLICSTLFFPVCRKMWAPFIFIVITICYEAAAVQIMNVISSFYAATVSLDRNALTSSLIRAICVVTVVSILKSLQTFLQEGGS